MFSANRQPVCTCTVLPDARRSRTVDLLGPHRLRNRLIMCTTGERAGGVASPIVSRRILAVEDAGSTRDSALLWRSLCSPSDVVASIVSTRRGVLVWFFT
eukprot:4948574-Pyramimonas_sp.AAC.1